MTRSTTLAFVATRGQWDRLETGPSLTANATVASLDFGLTCQLRAEGVPVADLFELIDGPTMPQCAEEAWDFCDRLRECLRGQIMQGDCDLVGRTASDLHYALRSLLVQTHLVVSAVEQLQPDRVVHFAEMERVIVWDPPDPPPDSFNAAVATVAARREIETVVVMASEPQESTGGGGDATAARPPRPLPRAPELLCWCQRNSAPEQGLLWSALAGADGCHGEYAILTDAVVPDELAAWCPSELVDELWDQSNLFKSVEAMRREGFPRGLCSGGRMERPDVCDNPFLDRIWGWYCYDLLNAAAHYRAGTLVASALAPRSVVAGYDAYGPCRALCQAFMDRGIPVLSILHGGLSGPVLARRGVGARAHVAAWGEFDAAAERVNREPAVRVPQIGSLRHDIDQAMRAGVVAQPGANGGASRILLFTTRLTGLLGTQLATSKLVESWHSLRKAMRRRSAWRFRVKPHPRYDYSELYRALGILAEPNVELCIGNAGEALAGVDVAVLVNTPSTVAVESLARGVPTVFLTDAILPDSGFWSPMLEGLVTVSSVAALEDAIDRLLADQDFKSEVLTRQKAFLARLVVASGDDAVARIRGVLEELSAECSSHAAVTRNECDYATVTIALLIGAMLESGLCSADVQAALAACDFKKALEDERDASMDLSTLSAYVVKRLAYGRWTARRGFAPGLVLALWRYLPRCMRPTLNQLRRMLANACLKESRQRDKFSPVRLFCDLALLVLAPRRLLSRGEGTGPCPA